MDEMEIVLNGDPRRVPAPTTLEGLLAHLELDPRTVVVEHNRRIARRPQLGDAVLAPGDTVELVHFVGGG